MSPAHAHRRQRGIALVTALIFLVVISLISVSSMRASRTELRMATNAEARSMAFQTAQAMLDAIAVHPAATPVVGGVGYTLCTPSEANCNRNDLALSDGLLASEIAGDVLRARVERMDPADRPPPRGTESSIDKFDAAAFEVRTVYDRAEERGGRITMVDGLLVLVPKTN
jgi:hypothetical protein